MRQVPLVLPLGMVAMGCTLQEAATEAPETTTSSAASAVVVVERTLGPGEAQRADTIVARFVKVPRGNVDDAALRVAGVAYEMPTLGTCTHVLDAPVASSRSIELLDVGLVSLEGTNLHPRAMPDPAGVVSGVFYAGRANDAFVPGGRVVLRAAGGPDLQEGFSVAVNAPAELANVRLETAPSTITVAWDAEADARDAIVVDVVAGAGRPLLRCADADRGRLAVPTTLDEGSLVVHRVRRESFRAPGIEPGELRFDVARVLLFRRGS